MPSHLRTQDQYKFVYDTLEEFIICGNSWFPVKELSQRLKEKSLKDPLTKMNSYQREYAQICKQTPRFTIGDCAGGHRGDNREKNRDVLCVPRELAVGGKGKTRCYRGWRLGLTQKLHSIISTVDTHTQTL